MDSAHKWDNNIEESKILYNLGQDVLILCERYKFLLLVSNRDFVYSLKNRRRDDEFFIVTKIIYVVWPVFAGTMSGK